MPDQKPFQFLRHDEFAKLDQDAKASYLVLAVRELGTMTASLVAASSKSLPDPEKE